MVPAPKAMIAVEAMSHTDAAIAAVAHGGRMAAEAATATEAATVVHDEWGGAVGMTATKAAAHMTAAAGPRAIDAVPEPIASTAPNAIVAKIAVEFFITNSFRVKVGPSRSGGSRWATTAGGSRSAYEGS